MSPSNSRSTTGAMPASPFFHPSDHENILQRTVGTPKGKHKRVLSVATIEAGDGGVGEAKSNILGCAANMATCIVGSGIVGLPYAVKNAGFVAGVCLIVLTATLTEKSLRLLIDTAKHVHKQSYETTAEVAFGVIGFRFM